MASRPPSFITKDRLGIYVFQCRIADKLIRKSLHTRNRREALKLNRRMKVDMEKLAEWENAAHRDDELFSIGKPLFDQLERLNNDKNLYGISEFLSSLNDLEERALRLVAERHERIEPVVNHQSTEQEILTAIREQKYSHLTSIPLLDAAERFTIEKKVNWKDHNFENHYRSSIFGLFVELNGNINTTELTKDHVIKLGIVNKV